MSRVSAQTLAKKGLALLGERILKRAPMIDYGFAADLSADRVEA
jgi:hypothetical protein